jgi:hypothetical protein
MSRRAAHPVRELSCEKRRQLGEISRARSSPAAWVVRAKLILAVSDGMSFEAAARSVGRRDGESVAKLIERFNREGLEAVVPRHGEVRHGGTAVLNGSGYWQKYVRNRTVNGMVQQHGH